jgi:phosphatidate cytidylyltransferase
VSQPDHSDAGAGGQGGWSDLRLRAASASVLAPLALAITYVGGWPFLALCTLAAGCILWEWTALVSRRADPRILSPGWAALLIAAPLIGLSLSYAALGVLLVGAFFGGVALLAIPSGGTKLSDAVWGACGIIYAGLSLASPALLRRDPEWGLTALLFLFATVWTTDIFAFFCGRVLGGPALWQRLSPHKTWSGAIGGVVGGVAGGVAVAYASGIAKLGTVGAMALLLSVLAQAGDLFESAVKRNFGAKDAGRLIPGHGGLMDRLDGFLVAALAALIIGILRHGAGSPARGLLVW